MDWKNRSKTLTLFILTVLIIGSISLGNSSGEEDPEIVAVDNIIRDGRVGPGGLNTAVYTEDDTVFFVVEVLIELHRYVKYDLSNYESEEILEEKDDKPFDDSLSTVYTGEEILIFGSQDLDQPGHCDKIYRVDLENEELTELDVTMPISSSGSLYHRIAVWAEDEAYVFLENGVHTFDPSDNSFEKHEVEYPEKFFHGSSDRSTVYADGDIYIVSFDEMFKYNTEDNELKKQSDLPTEHPDLFRRGAVYTGEDIYIMGAGELRRDPEITDEIIRYDPKSGEAELLETRLPEPMHSLDLIHHDGFIFIMGHIVEYDPTSKHARSTNEIYRFNYQGIDAPDDYPGPDHDDFPWFYVTLIGAVGGMIAIGAVYYYKRYKG